MPRLRLCDTHCHLDFPVFDAIRKEVLRASSAAGVERILVPGVVARDWGRLLDLCRDNLQLYPALGMHPCFLSSHQPADTPALELRLSDGEAIAVGEIGLDFWHGRDEEAAQIALLDAQLALAEQFHLPVLLHVRKAHDQMLALLRRRQLRAGGVVHGFSGSQQQAETYLGLGFRLGVGGAITYPRAKRLRQTVSQLPVDGLVLETDAPDMPLCGFQGQPNRPDRLPRVLEELAQLRQVSEVDLAASLWRNSCEVLALG